MTEYTYSISGDITCGQCLSWYLESQLIAAGIPVDHIMTKGDVLCLYTTRDLTAPELTTVSNTLAAHDPSTAPARPKWSTYMSFHVGFSGKPSSETASLRFPWPGSQVLGEPCSVNVVFSATSGNVYFYLFDLTNSQVIASVGPVAAKSPTFQSLGSLANVSAGEAVWELQVKTDGTSTVTIDALDVRI